MKERGKLQKIYLVPHCHYDVAWAFTQEEYLQIAQEVLRRVVELLKKFKEYRFCWEQIYPLKILEEQNPSLWEEIKEMIKEGRFEIVDGQYLMPDLMLPSGETLIREILFGKNYCKEKFGVEIPVAWCADSFGMNAQMPQLYCNSGYKWVGFRRGVKRMCSEFWWKGLDGTRILAHWMPLGYRAGLYLEKLEESYVKLNSYATTHHILMPSGSGSVPPQEETVKAVKEWNKKHKGSRMMIATLSDFFQALEKDEGLKKAEVREGELYDEDLIEVFPQVCSSRAWIVQGVRKCEKLLKITEQFSTIAWLLGKGYPELQLNECWEKMCFLAFHDIITGCGIDQIYDEVREILTFLEEKLSQLLNEALDYIAKQVGIGKEAVIVFNPLPWRTKNWCEVEIKLNARKRKPGLSVEGKEIETQILKLKKSGSKKIVSARLGFMAELPPLGYQVYEIVERRKEPNKGLTLRKNEVKNEFFSLVVDPATGMVKVYDKRGKLVLDGNKLRIENETGDLYYHRHMFFELIKDESGNGIYYGTFKPDEFKVEKGKLKTTFVIKEGYYCLRWPYRLFDKFPTKLFTHRVLDIIKEINVYRDLPRIEFKTYVKSRYPYIRLRIAFDTFKERTTYFRETQFGVVSEPTKISSPLEKGEVPSAIPHFLSWFWYGDGVRGITFMNRGLPASEIRGSKVFLTLLRSVAILSGDGDAGPLVPTPDALELNRDYVFEYAVQHGDGDWKESEAYKQGQEYCYLPLALQTSGNGNLPRNYSFLKLSPTNLLLSTIKKAEKENQLILRFFESKGETTEAEIELFREIKKCSITDLLERKIYELKPEGRKIKLKVKPFEIITLKIEI